VPLHVWLPDPWRVPTPISALIHAATMGDRRHLHGAPHVPTLRVVGAALSVVMVIGAIHGLLHGAARPRPNDIKRVVAYSTLSPARYMTVALGASAYRGGIFHLTTTRSSQALLFLGGPDP